MQVGVSAVCILGVNINAGQEISLRLRTDDLKVSPLLILRLLGTDTRNSSPAPNYERGLSSLPQTIG